MQRSLRPSETGLDELPKWDLLSEEKEVAQDRLTASLVHLVPIVVILCAILIWFFFYPETSTEEPNRLVRGKNLTLGRFETLKCLEAMITVV